MGEISSSGWSQDTLVERELLQTLDLCRSRIPLVATQAAAKPSTGSVLLMEMELCVQPDSGSFQYNLLQELLKEGGRIPKQEILFP